jgi:hypothetical protein
LQFAIPRILGFDEMFAGAPDVRDAAAPSALAAQDEPPF